MSGYRITQSGVGYLDRLVNVSSWSNKQAIEFDILGALEFWGGAVPAEEIINRLESRRIETPLQGTRQKYYNTIMGLKSKGYIEEEY